jgi:PAS domain S-box-containing protein
MEMARFQEFSMRVSSGLELQRLMNEVLGAISGLLKTEKALVLLAEAPGGELYPAAWLGLNDEQVEHFWRHSRKLQSFTGRRPMVINDAEVQSPVLAAAEHAAGTRALCTIPVLARSGELLASLICFFEDSYRPSEREVRLAELYARHASNAIENARLYGYSVETMHAERRRASLLRSLAEGSVRINSALNLDSLLQVITDEARSIIGAHQAFTSLAPGGDWSRMINCVSLSDKYSSAPEKIGSRALEISFFAGGLQQATRSGDLTTFPSWLSGDRQMAGRLAAPLTTGGRNIGLIELVEKVDGDFTEEDQAALTQLAQMATVAIENVRLYREAQEQIRERGRTQEALERSKEALDLTHQAAGIGAWEWNLQTGELTWSKEISALHGFAPERFDGRYASWLESVHPDDRDEVNTAVTRAISDGTGYQVQYRNLRPDGTVRWMEARGQVYYGAGRPLRMLGVAMDITVRRLAEEALRASEKLAATGRLAASIAHEINNPLASVTNILYLLNKNASLDHEARKFVTLAESELARVTHITRQTLAFYRESARPAPVSPAMLLDEVLALYTRNISERLITVERKYEFTGFISGFPGELRQVVSNLLLNAIEAVPVDGTIRVHLYRSRDLTREEGDGVHLVIADNGPGIPRELRRRIFEPFFSTKGEKGTGLGLWVSQGIIEKHGGRIRVRSSVRPQQSGTVFSVFLPMDHFAGETMGGEEMQAVA